MDKFKVKTPKGYIMVESKGAEDEYPGVYIGFSKDGKEYDVSRMITCVEFDTVKEDIITTVYKPNQDEPIEEPMENPIRYNLDEIKD